MSGIGREGARRWRMMLTLLAGALLALGTFWLVQLMNRNSVDLRPGQGGNAPDYIAERFSVVRMAASGLPDTIVSGALLTHRPADDSSEIAQPLVQQFTPGQPPLMMRAAQARIDQNNSRIELTGAVQVERAAGAGVQPMRLNTPALTVFPDADRMQTDAPVEMELGAARLNGTGMVANNATRQIDIAHRLRITYPPVPR